MSQIINTAGITPGCIHRIYLENFMTYREVEFFPGTALNLIVGPNGSGKSTFVCAIVMGLGGNTSIIGRATKLSGYIRTGCEHATIEIELYQSKGKRNVIVKRKINLQEVSKWFIDNEAVNERNIQQLNAKMNIQLNNLCQLLPQDRVQDFARLNSKELLKNTLAAVRGEESVKKLDRLIEIGAEQEELKKKVSQMSNQLNNLKRETDVLRVEVEAMKKRNEFEEQIQICERKKLWIEFKDLKEIVKQHESESNKARESLKKCEAKLKPLNNTLDSYKRRITEMDQNKISIVREIENLKEQIRETLEMIQSKEYIIRAAQISYEENVDRRKNIETELNQAKAKLEMYINNKKTLEESLGTESQLQEEADQLQQLINKTTNAFEVAKRKHQQVEYELTHQIIPQMKSCEVNLARLQNENNRMKALEAYNKDTYKAVEWLRQNPHLFTHPVHEPMMLVISFKEPKYARYLEASVPARDLLAFTFESKDDMNAFLRATRARGLRRVNAVHARAGAAPAARALGALAHLGFSAVLSQVFQAPAAVLRYLCGAYALHRVPLGDRHTYDNAAHVPASVPCFFTENHKFTVRQSAYSGETSSSTFELRPARLLAHSLDVNQIHELETRLSTIHKLRKEKENELNNIQTQLTTLETHEKKFSSEKKYIDNNLGKIKNTSALIHVQEKKKNKIANERTISNNLHEKLICQEKQKEAVLTQCSHHKDLLKMVEKLHRNLLMKEIITITLEKTRESVNEYKSKLRESEGELGKHKEQVENAYKKVTLLTSKAQATITKLKHICHNKLPNEPDFPYTAQFNALPSNLVQLQDHRFELETRMNAINPGDAQAIKYYKAKEKEIAELEKQEVITNNKIIELQNVINQIKRQWLTDVEEVIHIINNNFGKLFKRVDCAGEVKLQKGEIEDDFSAYGIGIWVKFREREQLMQLTRHTQSGGERSLSTALYLLALQGLADVPFRCVDEINQGMDSINERKMLQILVKETSDFQNSQYFLLTPKLLPGLEYNEHITVHTIMNGKSIMDYRMWNYDDILRKARSNRARSKK